MSKATILVPREIEFDGDVCGSSCLQSGEDCEAFGVVLKCVKETGRWLNYRCPECIAATEGKSGE